MVSLTGSVRCSRYFKKFFPAATGVFGISKVFSGSHRHLSISKVFSGNHRHLSISKAFHNIHRYPQYFRSSSKAAIAYRSVIPEMKSMIA